MTGNACTWRPSPVILVDGSEVLSDSEEWRFECEARWILDRLPNREVRRAHLEMIEKRRSLSARQALEDKIMEIWSSRQQVAVAASASA